MLRRVVSSSIRWKPKVGFEELVRRSLARLLTREGYTVIEAADGVEALAVLEAQGHAVDLMITDAIMPKMGGRALIEEASRLRPSLPILMVCGCTDKELAGGELSGNGRAFLTKPFEPPVLLSALRDPEALSSYLTVGRRRGMQSLSEGLRRLVLAGLISEEELQRHATERRRFHAPSLQEL